MKGNPATGSKPFNILQQPVTSYPIARTVSVNQEVYSATYKQLLPSFTLPGVDQTRQRYIVIPKTLSYTSMHKEETGYINQIVKDTALVSAYTCWTTPVNQHDMSIRFPDIPCAKRRLCSNTAIEFPGLSPAK